MGEDHGDGLEQSTASAVNMGSIVSGLLKTHGVPGKVKLSRFESQVAQINALFGARSKEQKDAVANTLTYLAIVHGCGPNVKWEEILCEPEGCTPQKMNRVVDGIITRAFHRRFMVNYSSRAIEMYDASPELQASLIPRAVRNGLPITDSKSVIDFLDSSGGVAPSVIAARTASKYSAVTRANTNSMSSIEKSALTAAHSMHEYGKEDDGDSLGGV